MAQRSGIAYLPPVTDFLNWGGLAVLLAGLVGCSDEPTERPPLIEGGGSNVTGGGSPGGAGAPGEGEEPGSLGAGAQVAGEVEAFLDDGFVLTQLYTQPATLFLFEDGSSESVETAYDGASYSAVVAPGSSYWVQVEPNFDTATFPTVSYVERATTSTELPVFPRSVVEEILGGLTSPTLVNDSRAQLIVQVVDGSGQPIAGVVPTAPRATDIAFEDGGLWRDNLEETTESGTFIAYNLAVGSRPGENILMLFTGSVDAEHEVRAIERSVTFVRLTVD